MGEHVDNYRAEDMPYVRTNDEWAYGERASVLTQTKLDRTIENVSAWDALSRFLSHH